MKKSTQVPATLIAALAAGFVVGGCSSSRRECVDAMGNPLPSTACTDGRHPGAHFITRGGFGGSSGGGFVGG